MTSRQPGRKCDSKLHTGKAAGKARKYVGKISSRLVRNIKGDAAWAEGNYVPGMHAGGHHRARSSTDLAIQDSTELSGEELVEEPLEKVPLPCLHDGQPLRPFG